MLARSIYKNSAILAAFALLSIGLIAVFHFFTKDKIAAEMRAKLARTLNELVPANQYNNDVYHDCLELDSNGLLAQKELTRFYRMYQDETPVASIFTVNAPDGYSGNIELIVGIYADQSLAGVRVINHNETPGLGDKIEKQKSDWILQFKGLSLTKVEAENWRVKKDGGTFDAFTGATITPRAVLKAIANALQYFKNNQQIIFTSSKNCGVNHEST